ncbi:MAG: aminoglycoside 3'-phosphotransferase [Caldilineaceae bacterium]
MPRLLDYREDEDHTYLLMSAIPGIDAATLAVEGLMEMATLVAELAHGLRQFHETPIAACPFDQTLARELPHLQARTAQRLVDEDNFDEERQGRSAASLLTELLATVPTTEDLVLTHGDYCLPNILLAENRVSGFIDLGWAGVADRYRDLALARRSIIRNCGGEWVAHFLLAMACPIPMRRSWHFISCWTNFGRGRSGFNYSVY